MTDDGTTRRGVLGMGLAGLAGLALPAPAAAQVSLEAMIGRMLMIGFGGSTTGSESAAKLALDIEAGRAGGVVFLGHNVKSREGVLGLTRLFREAGGRHEPFIALDHEGGKVQRLSARLGFTAIPEAQRIAARQSPEEARAIYAVAAADVRSAGFNLNLAPVVDLADPGNPVVGKYGRSYGRDPETVVRFARAFLEAHAEARVGAVLKHFPGHGLSRGDSHDGFVDITRTWEAEELVPFETLIASGDARAIMPGHLFHANFSEDGEPVSLSRKAVDGLLRGRLGFRGLVVTDDMDMAGIRSRYSWSQATIRAIAAGNDVIMLSNSLRPDHDLPRRAVDAVGEAVERGTLDRGRVEASYARITRFRAGLA